MSFNEQAYLAANPDVAAAVKAGAFGGDAYQHFLQHGQAEGRSPTGAPAASAPVGTPASSAQPNWSSGAGFAANVTAAPGTGAYYGQINDAWAAYRAGSGVNPITGKTAAQEKDTWWSTGQSSLMAPDITMNYILNAGAKGVRPEDYATAHADMSLATGDSGRGGILPTGQTQFERMLGVQGGTYYNVFGQGDRYAGNNPALLDPMKGVNISPESAARYARLFGAAMGDKGSFSGLDPAARQALGPGVTAAFNNLGRGGSPAPGSTTPRPGGGQAGNGAGTVTDNNKGREPVSGGQPGSGGVSAQSGGLSMAQQALLKALMDQAERDGITGETRANASELYDRAQSYERGTLNDINLLTGPNGRIYDRYQSDIENDVGTAVADARVGQTQALNTAARQAMRYGVSMPVGLAGVSSTHASQLAGAANTTRGNAIANYRNLIGQGIGLKDGVFKTSQAATADSMGRAEGATMANRNMRIQDESLEHAKQLDVTGMARGMPGASQGAYGVAVGAGNSAVQNQMAPGQALIGAMGQANNTTMQGRNLAMQGTLGVLNAQSNYANTVAQSGDSFGSVLGGIGGLAGGLAKIGVFSDRRLKEDIVAVGQDERTGLTLYEFAYKAASGKRYVGVMADEVEVAYPEAVFVMPDGFKAVNYQLLGIEFKEISG